MTERKRPIQPPLSNYDRADLKRLVDKGFAGIESYGEFFGDERDFAILMAAERYLRKDKGEGPPDA